MRSLAFYRDVLGCEVVSIIRNEIAWLKLGEVEVVLRSGKNHSDASSYAHSSRGIVLYCDDLDAKLRDLRSRGLEIRGTDGSPRCPTFTDPDGHWFQLVNPAEQ
jgi:catechol 2,3-dioxygenase-like lactoylglutathione lyase family enzyme